MAEKTNANIGFEKQLWDAACVLWGHIPAAEYRKVIIGLIFLRYISATFDKRYQELVEEGEGYEKLRKQVCVPEKDDILVGKDGARYFEDIVIYKQDEQPALLSSVAILRADCKKTIPEFLYYTLKTPAVKKNVRDNYGSGSAIPRIVLKDFKRMPFSFPSVDEQRKITALCSAIDSKIQVNNAINKNLQNYKERIHIMEGRLIAFVIWVIIGVLFIVMGIYDFNSKKAKPFGFWANAEVAPIEDVKGYNRALGILWCVYGVLFTLIGLPLLDGQNSGLIIIPILGAMLISIAAMVAYVVGIEPKYRKKK